MSTRQHPPLWILVGFMAGLAVAHLLPSEPAYSEVGNGNASDKVAMVTCITQSIGGVGKQADAVFLLDFLTGRLYGAALNSQSARFNLFYARSIAADFGLSADVQPKFVMCPGEINLGSRGPSGLPGQGGLYIAELNSGRVNLYAFPYQSGPKASGTGTLDIVDSFVFREQTIR
jgi:hypothetical protein